MDRSVPDTRGRSTWESRPTRKQLGRFIMVEGSVIKVKGEVRWNIEETQEGPWVGVCDRLGLTVQSDTWTELMEDIGAIVEFVFTDFMHEGRLEQFLAKHGWTCQNQSDHEPSALGNAPRFDIPFIPTLVRHESRPQALPA